MGRMVTPGGLVPFGDTEDDVGVVSLCRDCLVRARPGEEEEGEMDAYVRLLHQNGLFTPEQAIEAKDGLMCSHGNAPFFQQHLDWPVHQGCLCEFVGNAETIAELRESIQKGHFWEGGRVRTYAGEYDGIFDAIDGDYGMGYLDGFLLFRSMEDGSLFWVFQIS
jgi:hypothetical protein